MKRVLLLIGILALSFNYINAQDTIVKKDYSIIICKITEVGLDEIKYTQKSSGVVYSIDKLEIGRVVFESGTKMSFKDPFEDESIYKDQKKNIIKLKPLSPMYGFIDLGYERSIRPGASLEIDFGIVGLGFDPFERNATGVSFKVAYKFIKTPNYYVRGMRYSHLLKGLYFKPEIAFSSYKLNGNYPYLNGEEKSVSSYAFLFNIGNQWVFHDSFALDIYFGVGYGHSSEGDYRYQYGYTTGLESFPIALSSGFKLGILIK